jgi:hypothetical protein
MTSAIEDHCVKGMISTARPPLGIRGRQSRKALTQGPIYIEHSNRLETRSLPLHAHPGAIIMPLLRYPTALVGAALPSRDTPSKCGSL